MTAVPGQQNNREKCGREGYSTFTGASLGRCDLARGHFGFHYYLSPVSVPGGQPDEEEALTVFVQADRLDGGWVARVREMPGCASEGATVGEALRNVAEAWEGVTGEVSGAESVGGPQVGSSAAPAAIRKDAADSAPLTSSDEATVREALALWRAEIRGKYNDFAIADAEVALGRLTSRLAALSGALQEAKRREQNFGPFFFRDVCRAVGLREGSTLDAVMARVVEGTAAEGRVAELTAALTEQAMAMEEIGQYEFARLARAALFGDPDQAACGGGETPVGGA